MPSTNLIIVSGMSGAGRSAVADVLEDLGWFVVDNVPPMFLATMVEEIVGEGGASKLAVVVDVRTGHFFEALGTAVEELRANGYQPVTLFLEASDDVIVRRQESVRRPHPLQGGGRLLDGIQREREMLADLRVAFTGTNPRPVLLRGTAELCGGALDARVFKGLDELVRDQIMSMKTTFTPGHYRRRVAGVLARRLVATLFGE